MRARRWLFLVQIQRPTHTARRADISGKLLPRLGLAAAVAALGWIGWQSARTAKPSGTAAPTTAAQNFTPNDAGPLIIKVKNRSNQTEQMVLVPIASEPPPRNAPLPEPAVPSSSNTVRATPAVADDQWQRVLEAQLAMARQGISCGSLDGVIGSQTRAALRVFLQKAGRAMGGESNAVEFVRQSLDAPAFTNYTVTGEDLARLQPLGQTWLAKSQQDRLEFETVLELVAEKSQSHPNLIRRLNPACDWNTVTVGTTLRVPNAGQPPPRGKAAVVRIFLAARVLEAFDENTNLIAHFPCSIAQRVEKRPVGEELHVAVVAPDPNYTFDPEVFPESAEARALGRKLVLPPGPNNPVGVAWIGLDKPGYGIHGTPRPEDVGRTESHGCFRLANWNAEYLLKTVWVGLPVVVEP